jgi:TRAP-type C4-dicarboxylate transport system substrate-binding protein
MRRSSWALAGLALAAALLAGCGRAPAGPQPIVLRYASPYPPNHPFSQADIAWMRRVEAESGGQLKITPFWGGALVSSDYATLELAHGVADIALVTPIYSRGGMRAIKTQTGFYEGAQTPDQQVAVYRCLEKTFPVLDQEMAGVHVLAIQGGSLPNVITRSRPLRTLDDFRGLRLRTPSELAPLLRQLGADPVTMPMADVYSALSKGVIDGVVAPPDTLRSLHFAEVADTISLFAVPRGAYPARAISARSWARLPPKLQAVLAANEPYWEDQLDRRVAAAAADGLAFGRAHGERVVQPTEAEQGRFLVRYDATDLAEAKREATPDFDGPAMLAAAHQAIARLHAGQPAC